MRLKGYGNAICVPLASEFIRAATPLFDSKGGGDTHEAEKDKESQGQEAALLV